MRILRAFGAFWFDFLVGDRWELFLGPIIVLVATWGIVALGAPDLLAAVVLVAGIVVVGVLSVALALRPGT